MGGKSGLAGFLGPKFGPGRVFRPNFESGRVFDPTRVIWVGSLGAKPAPYPLSRRVGAGWIRVNPTRSAAYASSMAINLSL